MGGVGPAVLAVGPQEPRMQGASGYRLGNYRQKSKRPLVTHHKKIIYGCRGNNLNMHREQRNICES